MTSPAQPIFMTVHIDASADLNAVNASVKRYEETIGPLVALGTDKGLTLLKFDAMSASPQSIAVVAKEVGGIPQIPDGATLVASGQIYLQGVQTTCAATRA
jgi:hypothetical protein